MTFGEYLNSLRLMNFYCLSKFVDLVEIPGLRITDIENDRVVPTEQEVQRIAKVLCLKRGTLYGDAFFDLVSNITKEGIMGKSRRELKEELIDELVAEFANRSASWLRDFLSDILKSAIDAVREKD